MIHTASAGGVVLNAEGKVLVVNQHGNSWSLPKGHVEEGEGEVEAAKREIYEETGVRNLTFVKPLGSYQRHKIGKDGGEDRTELKTIAFFLFRTEDVHLKPLDPDNPEARWVLKEEVAGLLTHPRDREFFLSVSKKLG